MSVLTLRYLIIGVLAAVATMGSSATGSAAPIPPLSDAARAAGFVDVRAVVPDAVIDLRYATSNNFVGIPLYPPTARCLVHESLAGGLATAARLLRAGGERLVFWDCYRPHAVQARMFEVVPNPAWVARPGPYARSHVAGRSVDVTLALADRLVDMGTGFDDFTARSLAYATEGISVAAQANRARLRDAMTAGGFTVYDGEWWHFDGPGAGVDRPIPEVPVT
ncbi:D-alanyl-D-alanine dipeptidase [Mycolicibacterium gilvum Spyr1]|uniref:D-alanyl-D-alanine dipeptidase n=2 Tax=Mycolicibacterium gilvum TaxID=1804 RepID=E6TED2_MYCSR|nr:D-alanyl-D-alanine dipeptidase [Mycolicibacterium gilvum Spyr1]